MTSSTGTPSFVNSYHSVGAGIIITCTTFKSLKLENSPSHLTTKCGFYQKLWECLFWVPICTWSLPAWDGTRLTSLRGRFNISRLEWVTSSSWKDTHGASGLENLTNALCYEHLGAWAMHVASMQTSVDPRLLRVSLSKTAFLPSFWVYNHCINERVRYIINYAFFLLFNQWAQDLLAVFWLTDSARMVQIRCFFLRREVTRDLARQVTCQWELQNYNWRISIGNTRLCHKPIPACL